MEDTRTIELTQGKVAIVDATDFEWLSQWRCGPLLPSAWQAIKLHGEFAVTNEMLGAYQKANETPTKARRT